MNKIILYGIILLGFPVLSSSQEAIHLNRAIDLALQNNRGLQSSKLEVERLGYAKDASKTIDKSTFFYGYDHNNVADNGSALHVLGASQSFKMPGYYQALEQVGNASMGVQSAQASVDEYLIKRTLHYIYNDYRYWQSVRQEQVYMDSLFQRLEATAIRRLEIGDATNLERVSAIAKRRIADINIRKADQEITKAVAILNSLIQSDATVVPIQEGLSKIPLDIPELDKHPQLSLWQNRQTLATAEVELADKQSLPEWSVSAFAGLNSFSNLKLYPGIEIGISIPLWKKAFSARSKSAQLAADINALEQNNVEKMLEGQLTYHTSNLRIVDDEINTYLDSGISLEQEIEETATQSYNEGEIGFLEYVIAMENASAIRQNYLASLHSYNQYIISINYLINP